MKNIWTPYGFRTKTYIRLCWRGMRDVSLGILSDTMRIVYCLSYSELECNYCLRKASSESTATSTHRPSRPFSSPVAHSAVHAGETRAKLKAHAGVRQESNDCCVRVVCICVYFCVLCVLGAYVMRRKGGTRPRVASLPRGDARLSVTGFRFRDRPLRFRCRLGPPAQASCQVYACERAWSTCPCDASTVEATRPKGWAGIPRVYI